VDCASTLHFGVGLHRLFTVPGACWLGLLALLVLEGAVSPAPGRRDRVASHAHAFARE